VGAKFRVGGRITTASSSAWEEEVGALLADVGTAAEFGGERGAILSSAWLAPVLLIAE
jgi:hypothetical protein